SASRTSSSLKGLTIASIFFTLRMVSRRVLAEGRAVVELVDVGRDMRAFAAEEIVDGAVEGRMRQPMERARRLRQEAARVLVLALRAALEEQEDRKSTRLNSSH